MRKKLLIALGSIFLVGALSLTGCGNNNGGNNVANNEEANIQDNSGEDTSADNEGAEGAQFVELGQLAPDFTLQNLDGEEVSLSDYRGQKVFLNFWATWCKYCVEEMPDFEVLRGEYDDVEILAVNVQESEEQAKAFIEDGGYTFPVVLDESGSVAIQYLISAFPTTYFIDEDGVVVGMFPGKMTYEQMEDFIRQMNEL